MKRCRAGVTKASPPTGGSTNLVLPDTVYRRSKTRNRRQGKGPARTDLKPANSRIMRPDDVGHRGTKSSTTEIPNMLVGLDFGMTYTGSLLYGRYGNLMS
jgi:hypothetical protein